MKHRMLKHPIVNALDKDRVRAAGHIMALTAALDQAIEALGSMVELVIGLDGLSNFQVHLVVKARAALEAAKKARG